MDKNIWDAGSVGEMRCSAFASAIRPFETDDGGRHISQKNIWSTLRDFETVHFFPFEKYYYRVELQWKPLQL